MKLLRLAVLSTAITALAGCSDDDGPIVAPTVPLASTRFINAMPDTGATDWRFVDQLENSPVALGLAFRSFSPYQATAPGARPLKVFTTSDNILLTSRTFTDRTLTLDPSKRYTLLQVGNARGQDPAQELLVIEDVFPTVPANQVAIRIVHAGAGLGPIDVYAAPALGAGAFPSTPLVSNLAYRGVSPYVLVNATPNTGLGSLAATATGFSRTTGSFLTDGFAVGQQITGNRFGNAANNTRSTIIGVTATTLTIGPASGTFSGSAGADSSYSRTTGSFVADGFTTGMRITIAGFGTAANNQTTTVSSVTATKLKVGTATAVEAEAAGRTIVRANVVEAEAPNRLIVAELVLRATNAGTTTVVAELTAPTGLPAEPINNLEPVGGTGMPGSVLTAFFMPRSVAGSKAASFTTPNFVYTIDKHPR